MQTPEELVIRLDDASLRAVIDGASRQLAADRTASLSTSGGNPPDGMGNTTQSGLSPR